MTKTVVLIALAGLGSTAAAQSLSAHVSIDQSELGFGDTATATLAVSFTTASGDPGSYLTYASGVNLLAVAIAGDASAGFGVSNLQIGGWHMPGLGSESTTIDGGSILDLFVAQHALFGDVDTTNNSIVVATWTITGYEVGWFRYSGSEGSSPNPNPGFAVIDGADGLFALPTVYDPGLLTSDEFVILPPPSGVGMLYIGGILCSRRKRC